MFSNEHAQKVVPQQGKGFDGLGIAPKILELIDRIKFKIPTPIQLKVIPIALEGKDLVGIAQTGTGKTHAFAVPMIQLLAQKKGTGLVLAPSGVCRWRPIRAAQPTAHFGAPQKADPLLRP